ncbi:MAG: Hpt domain-containing protein, partial [Gemmatimonas sp.]
MPVIPNSLNDAVALLIQLEVTDTGDLALLRDALSAMGPEQGVSGEARPVVESAAHLLTAIIDGSAADPEADLALVSQALDEALNTLAPVTETVPSVDALTPPRKSRARSAKKPASPSETVSGPSGARQTPGTRNDDRADARVVSSSASSMAESLPSPTAAALSTDRLPPGSDRLLLRDFVNESAEYLAEAESALLALEANPHDAEAVNTVFRGFHTVKGTASVLGLPLIADFAHEAESLLMRVRDREFSFGPQCADLSLRSVDMLKLLLGVVEAALSGDGQLLPPSGYHSLMVAIDGYNPSADILAVETAMAGEPAARAGHLDLAHDATIRVRTDRLDRLINMVGELVIAQTMIAGDRHLSVGDSSELSRKVSHAGKIVR